MKYKKYFLFYFYNLNSKVTLNMIIFSSQKQIYKQKCIKIYKNIIHLVDFLCCICNQRGLSIFTWKSFTGEDGRYGKEAKEPAYTTGGELIPSRGLRFQNSEPWTLMSSSGGTWSALFKRILAYRIRKLMIIKIFDKIVAWNVLGFVISWTSMCTISKIIILSSKNYKPTTNEFIIIPVLLVL